MKSSRHKRFTVNNNLNATNNVLAAIVESGLDIHLVHLGTMGVYGYGTVDMQIPEDTSTFISKDLTVSFTSRKSFIQQIRAAFII